MGGPLYKSGFSPPMVNSLPGEASLKAKTPLVIWPWLRRVLTILGTECAIAHSHRAVGGKIGTAQIVSHSQATR